LYVLAAGTADLVSEEFLRLRRASGRPGIMLMHAVSSSYVAEPNGEYHVGVIGRRRLEVIRGRERHMLRPGDLAIWDPSDVHSGAPLDGGPWEVRMLTIEHRDLDEVAADPTDPVPDLAFPEPIVRESGMAREFVEVHRALEGSPWTLERQAGLADLFQRLSRLSPAYPSRPAAARLARTDPALIRACDFLRDNLDANVSLDELAAAAEVSKFRIVRLFRAGLGLPPHRYQLAQRLKLARRLLERGCGIAETAARTGFVDQSHLHRHFRRAFGLSPGAYRGLVQA
jgi:AraC-like DNA-binding protein